jgi:hypothetical protein
LICIGTFATLFLVYYLNDEKRWESVRKYFKNSGNFNALKALFWISIISLAIAFLNALFGIIGSSQGSRYGKGYSLFFGFLWLVLAVLTIIFSALLFKDFYKLSKEKPLSCSAAADIAHEREYVRGWSKFCNGKYLPAGETCRKGDFYTQWENKQELRSLNPQCCPVANDIVFWPFFILAIFGIFLGLSQLIAAGSNIGLTNYPIDLDDHYKGLGINDYLALGILLCLGIFLFFYLFFRPAPNQATKWTSGIQGFNLNSNGDLIPKNSFTSVNKSLVSQTFKDNCFSLLK